MNHLDVIQGVEPNPKNNEINKKYGRQEEKKEKKKGGEKEEEKRNVRVYLSTNVFVKIEPQVS